MKILVLIGNVPDTTTKIKFNADQTGIDTAGVQWIINPWDEFALTRAMELKEAYAGAISSVVVANVGSSQTEPTLRKALAVGADKAIRIDAEAKDAFFVATQLAQIAEEYELILAGIEASDYNGSAVGGMLAELLDRSSVSAVTGLDLKDDKLLVTREIDGGNQHLLCTTPLLAIVQKGIAKEPRIAAMRGIMMARSKVIKVVEPASIEPLTEVAGLDKPQPGVACRFIDPEKPELLIELLQNEAKVI